MGQIVDKSIQETFIYAIDAKIVEAGEIMDLADLTDDEVDNADVHDTVYEERYHCGKCVVRTVMETVWPSVDEYLDFLEGTIRGYEQSTADAHASLKRVFTSLATSGVLSSMTIDERDALVDIMATLNMPPLPIMEDSKKK